MYNVMDADISSECLTINVNAKCNVAKLFFIVLFLFILSILFLFVINFICNSFYFILLLTKDILLELTHNPPSTVSVMISLRI